MPEKEETTGRPTYAACGMYCYLAGVLFPIIFLTTKPYKSNRFVRFHAFQSLLFFAAWFVVFVASSIPVARVVGRVVSLVLLVFLVVWIVLMINAYKGRMTKLPVLGNLAERYAR